MMCNRMFCSAPKFVCDAQTLSCGNPFNLFINVKLEIKIKQFCRLECFTLQQKHNSHISHIMHMIEEFLFLPCAQAENV